MNKKTLFLILIGLIIAGFVGFWLYRETMFSKEILRLEILGPENAEMGEEIEYTVKYKNNGNFSLQNPKLIFLLPDDSLTEDSKTRITQNLEDIYPGAEEFVKIKTRLLGKEGDLRVAKASLTYTPKNLTASFESTTTFTTKIDKVPITLDFDMPSKVEKGKDVQYSINYFSNIDYPLENLSLKIEPVSGFNFTSSSPASIDNLEWKLPTLNKAQGGRVTIKGKISSATDQNLAFKVYLGMWKNGNFIIIKEGSADAQVIQPLLFISQLINGSGSYVASPGDLLHYQVFFRNIGSTPFDNLFMVVKLDGEALDLSSIEAEGAQVQSNMIVWDSTRTGQLKHLDAQQQGEIDFSVKVKSDWNTTGVDSSNIVITDEINISQIIQKFTTKVNSGLVVTQSAFYKSSDIENSGPVPPVAGKSTTYTISWNIKNYFSDAKNVKVKAVLPANVSLTGKIMPQDELANFSYDSASRQIVWSAGDVLAGTGVRGDPVTLSFQISLTPQAGQKGFPAPLIGAVTISGENQFTNTVISAGDESVSTSLPDDFSHGGIVQ